MHECARDVRLVNVIKGSGGVVEVREHLSGPSALIAYGEAEHGLRVLFAPSSVSDAERAVNCMGCASIEEYLADDKNDVIDLMDLCDASGVAYTFVGIGPKTGVVCRPVS